MATTKEITEMSELRQQLQHAEISNDTESLVRVNTILDTVPAPFFQLIQELYMNRVPQDLSHHPHANTRGMNVGLWIYAEDMFFTADEELFYQMPYTRQAPIGAMAEYVRGSPRWIMECIEIVHQGLCGNWGTGMPRDSIIALGYNVLLLGAGRSRARIIQTPKISHLYSSLYRYANNPEHFNKVMSFLLESQSRFSAFMNWIQQISRTVVPQVKLMKQSDFKTPEIFDHLQEEEANTCNQVIAFYNTVIDLIIDQEQEKYLASKISNHIKIQEILVGQMEEMQNAIDKEHFDYYMYAIYRRFAKYRESNRQEPMSLEDMIRTFPKVPVLEIVTIVIQVLKDTSIQALLHEYDHVHLHRLSSRITDVWLEYNNHMIKQSDTPGSSIKTTGVPSIDRGVGQQQRDIWDAMLGLPQQSSTPSKMPKQSDFGGTNELATNSSDPSKMVISSEYAYVNAGSIISTPRFDGNMQKLYQLKTRISVLNWSTTSTGLLTSIPVTPQIAQGFPTQNVPIMTYESHPMLLMSQHSNYWRGSLTYTIQVVGTQNHSGTLLVTYHPGPLIPNLAINDILNLDHTTIDAGSAKDVDMVVPYQSVYERIPTAGVPFCINGSTLVKTTNPVASTGYIYVYVFNPLAAALGVDTTIELNIYLSSSDMQFYSPGRLPYKYTDAGTTSSLDIRTVIANTYEASDEDTDDEFETFPPITPEEVKMFKRAFMKKQSNFISALPETPAGHLGVSGEVERKQYTGTVNISKDRLVERPILISNGQTISTTAAVGTALYTARLPQSALVPDTSFQAMCKIYQFLRADWEVIVKFQPSLYHSGRAIIMATYDNTNYNGVRSLSGWNYTYSKEFTLSGTDEVRLSVPYMNNYGMWDLTNALAYNPIKIEIMLLNKLRAPTGAPTTISYSVYVVPKNVQLSGIVKSRVPTQLMAYQSDFTKMQKQSNFLDTDTSKKGLMHEDQKVDLIPADIVNPTMPGEFDLYKLFSTWYHVSDVTFSTVTLGTLKSTDWQPVFSLRAAPPRSLSTLMTMFDFWYGNQEFLITVLGSTQSDLCVKASYQPFVQTKSDPIIPNRMASTAIDAAYVNIITGSEIEWNSSLVPAKIINIPTTAVSKMKITGTSSNTSTYNQQNGKIDFWFRSLVPTTYTVSIKWRSTNLSLYNLTIPKRIYYDYTAPARGRFDTSVVPEAITTPLAIKKSEYVKDLTQDGDVESNPGPISSSDGSLGNFGMKLSTRERLQLKVLVNAFMEKQSDTPLPYVYEETSGEMLDEAERILADNVYDSSEEVDEDPLLNDVTIQDLGSEDVDASDSVSNVSCSDSEYIKKLPKSIPEVTKEYLLKIRNTYKTWSINTNKMECDTDEPPEKTGYEKWFSWIVQIVTKTKDQAFRLLTSVKDFFDAIWLKIQEQITKSDWWIIRKIKQFFVTHQIAKLKDAIWRFLEILWTIVATISAVGKVKMYLAHPEVYTLKMLFMDIIIISPSLNVILQPLITGTINKMRKQSAFIKETIIPILISCILTLLFGLTASRVPPGASQMVMKLIAPRVFGEGAVTIFKAISLALQTAVKYWLYGEDVASEYIAAFNDQKESITTLMGAWMEVVTKGGFIAKNIGNKDSTLFPNTTNADLVILSMNKVKELRPLSAWLERSNPTISKWMEDVILMHGNLLKMQEFAQARTEPIGACFMGDPGVGKTILTNTLLPEDVLMMVGKIHKREEAAAMVYSAPTSKEAKFFDSYTGQPWFLYDDFGAMTDGHDFTQIVNMISPAAYIMNMADIKDKGSVLISDFIILNTNLNRLTNDKIMNTPDAMTRRFTGRTWKVEIKDEFKKRNESNQEVLDMMKVSNELLLLQDKTANNLMQFYERIWIFHPVDPATGQVTTVVPDTYFNVVNKLYAALMLRRDTSQVFNLERMKYQSDFEDKIVNDYLNGVPGSEARLFLIPNLDINNLVRTKREKDRDLDIQMTQDEELLSLANRFCDVAKKDCHKYIRANITLTLAKIIDCPNEVYVKEMQRLSEEVLYSAKFYQNAVSRYRGQILKKNMKATLQLLLVAQHGPLEAAFAAAMFESRLIEVPDAKAALQPDSDLFTFDLKWKHPEFDDLKNVWIHEILPHIYTRYFGINMRTFIRVFYVIAILVPLAFFCFILYRFVSMVMSIFQFLFMEKQMYSVDPQQKLRKQPIKSSLLPYQSNFGKYSENRIARNLRLAHIQTPEGITANTYALFLDTHNFIIPTHFLERIYSNPGHHLVVEDLDYHENARLQHVPTSKLSWNISSQAGSDLTMVRTLKQFQNIRNIKDRFLTEEEMEQYLRIPRETQYYNKDAIDNVVFVSEDLIYHTEDGYYSKSPEFGTNPVQALTFRTTKPTTVGNCGLPYTTKSAHDKVIAIHVTGTGNLIIGQKIFKEQVDEVLKVLDDMAGKLHHIEFEPEKLVGTVTPVQPEEVSWVDPTFELVGKCTFANGQPIKCDVVTKSEISSSPLFSQEEFPDGRAPSKLSKNILVRRSQKYGYGEKQWFQVPAIFHYFALLYIKTMFSLFKSQSRRTTLSEYEVINGYGNTFNSLKIDTSIGYWKEFGVTREDFLEELPRGDQDKKYYKFSSLAYTLKNPHTGRSLVEELEHKIEQGKKGIRTEGFWTSTLKSELQSQAKVAAGDTRVIEVPSFDILLVQRRTIGAFVDFYQTNPGFIFMHAISWDPNQVCEIVYKELTRWEGANTEVVVADYKTWDGSVDGQNYTFFAQVMDIYYDDEGSSESKLRHTLVNEMCEGIHIIGDLVAISSKGTKSGQLPTLVGNSLTNLYNVLTSYAAVYYAKRGHIPTIEHFIKNVRALTMGDDLIIAVSPLMREEYNGETIHAFLQNHGWAMTAEDKTEIKKSVPIAQATFLKSKWAIVDGHMVFQLPKNTIHQQINWIRRNATHDVMIRKQMLENVMSQAVMYGREYYNELIRKIKRQLHRDPALLTVGLTFVTYEHKFTDHIDNLAIGKIRALELSFTHRHMVDAIRLSVDKRLYSITMNECMSCKEVTYLYKDKICGLCLQRDIQEHYALRGLVTPVG